MRCPGQDSRYWKADAIFDVACPSCGQRVEFFKDEPTRKCRNCGEKVVNPKMDFGCASYCQFAEQCLGTLPPELLAERKELLKDRVAVEMKRHFKRDFKRIGHTIKVARYAEAIAKEERGDPAVVLVAAYLHDMGPDESGQRGGDAEERDHELGGSPRVREILTRLRAPEALIRDVCDIVGHRREPGSGETTNSKALHDADVIANLEEDVKASPRGRPNLGPWIEQNLLTEAGHRLAKGLLLK
jgi:putative nucleotidyltransferase with HDIG domain